MSEKETLGALKQLYEAFIKMNNGCYPIDQYPAALYKKEAMDRAAAVLETASEHEWLLWFYQNADFGPGDGDAQHHMKQRFMKETGKNLPKGYQEED
jgi:hypothetical protein